MEWAAGAGCGLRAFSTGKGTATSFVTTCGEEHGRGEAMDRVQLEERGISCNNEITNNKTGTLLELTKVADPSRRYASFTSNHLHRSKRTFSTGIDTATSFKTTCGLLRSEQNVRVLEPKNCFALQTFSTSKGVGCFTYLSTKTGTSWGTIF